jgi:ubiquinone/menaquinone biosynthesis C-methylase UbiE
MTKRLLAVITVVLLGVASGAAKQATSPQQQRSPEEYAKFLEGAERVARMQVPRVVQTLALKPGVKVADIGSGSGLFTRPIAAAIAPAPVYAVDIEAALLKIVESRAKEAGLANVRTVLGAPDDPKLPERVDLIFLCDTLHHIANPGPYLQTIRQYLAPGGRVAVIDFGDRWPEGHEKLRYSVAQFEQWMTSAGYVRVESHDWLENSFFRIYR